jgi:hypothetical protein
MHAMAPPVAPAAGLGTGGRAANQLIELGIAVGALQEDGSEALVPIESRGIGRFRLVGSWLPGWEEELAQIQRERSGS